MKSKSKPKKSLFLLIPIVGVLVIGFLITLNFTLVKVSGVELNHSIYKMSFDQSQKERFVGLSTKLNLALLRFDGGELDKSAFALEVRLAILENSHHPGLDTAASEESDIDVKLFYVAKTAIDKLLGQQGIDPQKLMASYKKMTDAFLLVRLRQFPRAVAAYSEYADPLPDTDPTLVPSLIFRGYSNFMSGRVQAALADLNRAKELATYEYYPVILYLLTKIDELLTRQQHYVGSPLLAGINAYKTLNFALSESLLLSVLSDAKSPSVDKATSTYYLARLEEEKGNFSLAVQIYAAVRDAVPDFAVASAARGLLLKKYFLKEDYNVDRNFLVSRHQTDLLIIVENTGPYIDSSLAKAREDYARGDYERVLAKFEASIPALVPPVVAVAPKKAQPALPTSTSITPLVAKVQTIPPIVPTVPDLKAQANLAYRVAIEAKLKGIETKLADTTKALADTKTYQLVSNTTQIAGYTTTVASTAVAAYNVYQIAQVNSLLAQGINPATVQGMSADTTAASSSAVWSSVLAGGALLVSAGFSLWDNFVSKPEDKKKALEHEIQVLEAEKAVTKDQLSR